MKIKWNELTVQQVGLLAICATLISAVMAASGALTSACINGHNARDLAHRAAVRDYRMSLVEAPLKDTDEAFVALQDVIFRLNAGDYSALTQLASMSDGSKRSQVAGLLPLSDDLRVAVARFQEVVIKQITLLRDIMAAVAERKDPTVFRQRVDAVFADYVVAYSALRRAAETFVFSN